MPEVSSFSLFFSNHCNGNLLEMTGPSDEKISGCWWDVCFNDFFFSMGWSTKMSFLVGHSCPQVVQHESLNKEVSLPKTCGISWNITHLISPLIFVQLLLCKTLKSGTRIIVVSKKKFSTSHGANGSFKWVFGESQSEISLLMICYTPRSNKAVCLEDSLVMAKFGLRTWTGYLHIFNATHFLLPG